MSFLSYNSSVRGAGNSAPVFYPPGTRVGDVLFVHISIFGPVWPVSPLASQIVMDSTWSLIQTSSNVQEAGYLYFSRSLASHSEIDFTTAEITTASTSHIFRASMYRFDGLVSSTTALIYSSFTAGYSTAILACPTTTSVIRNTMHMNYMHMRGFSSASEFTGESGGNWKLNVTTFDLQPSGGMQTGFLFSTGGISGGSFPTSSTYRFMTIGVSWELDTFGKYGRQHAVNYRRGGHRTKTFGRV